MQLNPIRFSPAVVAAGVQVELHRRAKNAWRAAALAAALNVVGMPLDALIARSVPGVPTWANAASAVIGAFLLAFLVVKRRSMTMNACGAVFLVNALVIVAALWFSNGAYAESGRAWVPFQANKLGMLTVALLATEVWVGVPAICAYAGMAIAQNATFSPIVRSHLALGEPWATVAIAVFATALLLFRLRRDGLQQDVARAQGEARALEKLAGILLEHRDLSNTPLQTIAFSAALIREAHPGPQPALDHIERALGRLKELDGALKLYEPHGVWAPAAPDDADAASPEPPSSR